MASAVALIPARSGSKRVPDKNIRRLGDHPLLAYSICSALDSGVFDAVVVSTDSSRYADIARYYGAEVPFLRDPAIAGDTSPDIEWIQEMLTRLADAGRSYDCFSILRPTSPFRKAHTIQRAWQLFSSEQGVDSLRAVEPCAQHPGKMWVARGNRLLPLLPLSVDGTPFHSCQYAALPEILVQNASLEIARTSVALEGGTIAGETVVPFLTQDDEGLDINSPMDWKLCEMLIEQQEAVLPPVSRVAMKDTNSEA